MVSPEPSRVGTDKCCSVQGGRNHELKLFLWRSKVYHHYKTKHSFYWAFKDSTFTFLQIFIVWWDGQLLTHWHILWYLRWPFLTCILFIASRSWSSWWAELRASRRMSVNFISLSLSSLRNCMTVSASLSVHSEILGKNEKETWTITCATF